MRPLKTRKHTQNATNKNNKTHTQNEPIKRTTHTKNALIKTTQNATNKNNKNHTKCDH